MQKNGELVLVRVTFWGGEGKKPEGEVEEVLGDPYNTNTMIEALIKEGRDVWRISSRGNKRSK